MLTKIFLVVVAALIYGPIIGYLAPWPDEPNKRVYLLVTMSVLPAALVAIWAWYESISAINALLFFALLFIVSGFITFAAIPIGEWLKRQFNRPTNTRL